MSSIYDMEDDDVEMLSTDCLVALKFPDDFAEFQARAEGGGSTYGVLKRHGFAQHSLRVVAPSDPEVDVVVPQRRANSLVAPDVSSRPHSTETSFAGNAQSGPKNGTSFYTPITSSNINRFSKFFHRRIQKKELRDVTVTLNNN